MQPVKPNLVVVMLVAAFCALAAGSAEAITCESACSQIRRACIHESKAVGKVAFADCDEAKDACQMSCQTDPATCQNACQAANASCLAACAIAPDPALCQSDCALALSACPTECPDCCSATRASCRSAAKADRVATKLLCDTARASCGGLCVEPIDPACVRGCMNDQKGCQRAAKGFERACKDSCVTGPGRRACFRECRKQANEGYRICSSQEALCIGGCIGVVTP